MIKRYRQIPVELEAIQWTGKNFSEIEEFLNGNARLFNGCLFIKTANGDKPANVSEYITKSGTEDNMIIRNVDADIFEKVYEEVEN